MYYFLDWGFMLITRFIRGFSQVSGIYKIYEMMLEKEIKNGPMPNHIAFILDGNRRWALSQGFPKTAGYRWGASKAEEVLNWCLELGVKTVTLYILSTENIRRRSKEELDAIYSVIKDYARKALNDERFDKNKVKVKVIGLYELLPRDVASLLKKLEEKTKTYDKHVLNLAVAYGGRREIVEATKRIIKEVLEGRLKPSDIDEDIFEKYLFTGSQKHPNPDLVIRTSGEYRLSNFLIWQTAYSELVFLDAYWPEFRRIDLLRAIRLYQKRSRRFGA